MNNCSELHFVSVLYVTDNKAFLQKHDACSANVLQTNSICLNVLSNQRSVVLASESVCACVCVHHVSRALLGLSGELSINLGLKSICI